MTTLKKMRRLNEVQEVAAIREQLQFLKCRLAQPVPAGIVQQVEEALHSLRVLENLARQYYERRASE